MIYRKATFNDVEDIFELVNDYAQDVAYSLGRIGRSTHIGGF